MLRRGGTFRSKDGENWEKLSVRYLRNRENCEKPDTSRFRNTELPILKAMAEAVNATYKPENCKYLLPKWETLKSIDLSGSRLKGIKYSLRMMPNLEVLNLSDNSDLEISGIQFMSKKIKRIDFTNSFFDSFSQLDYIYSLNELILTNAYIEFGDIQYLKLLTNLEVLNFKGIRNQYIRDLRPLAGLTKLRHLEVDVEHLIPESPKNLKELKAYWQMIGEGFEESPSIRLEKRINNKPTLIKLDRCIVYSSKLQEGEPVGWQVEIDFRTGGYLSVCTRQKIKRVGDYVLVAIGETDIKTGQCCKVGGFYRSKDGDKWEEISESEWNLPEIK